MYHLIILCLLLSSTTLLCMDQPSFVPSFAQSFGGHGKTSDSAKATSDASTDKLSQKMINLKLDDDSQYSIQKWKAKKESNTLCECYYSQKKQNPIFVPNISTEEIILFDAALDKNINQKHPTSFSNYYDKLTPTQQRTLTIACGQYGSDGAKKLCALRLTAQLADKWLGHDIASRAVVTQCTPEYSDLEMHLKAGMIIENIHNNLIVQSAVSSYNLQDCSRMHQKNGSVLYAPKINSLNLDNFTGKPNRKYLTIDGKMYLRVLVTEEPNFAVSSAEIVDNKYDLRVHHIWSSNKKEIVKTINFYTRSEVILSPDDKWMITFSSDPDPQVNGNFILTQLDPLSDQYLSDITIPFEYDFKNRACFNKASSVLAFAAMDEIILFSLQKKNIFLKLKSRSMKRSFFSKKGIVLPIALTFNHDDTRLISCFLESSRGKGYLVTIWDTSDLDNIKELQSINLEKQIDSKAIITFNYPEQDIIAISTDSATSFLNINSGAFLSQTEAPKEQAKYSYAADCSIPSTPIKCIAKNIDDEASCVNFYDYRSGTCLATILFNTPKIMAMGMTHDAKSLVTAFEGLKSITTELLSDQDANIMSNMSLVDFYGLLQLYKAKKNNEQIKISATFFEYMKNFSEGKSYKKIIEKSLLNIPQEPEQDILQSVSTFFSKIFS